VSKYRIKINLRLIALRKKMLMINLMDEINNVLHQI
jgi:hypothetical protein